MKPMHKIKELCKKNGDTFIGRNVSLYYIDESGEYNLCLDVARSLPMALCLKTHTFYPMLLMKSIHNLNWKAKEKLSQAQSSA
jgi:hypothetical protein